MTDQDLGALARAIIELSGAELVHGTEIFSRVSLAHGASASVWIAGLR